MSSNPVVETPNRIHPLVATAAISVTVLSLAGVAAMTGLIQTPFAKSGDPPARVADAQPFLAPPVAPIAFAAPVALTAPVVPAVPAVPAVATSAPVAPAASVAAARPPAPAGVAQPRKPPAENGAATPVRRPVAATSPVDPTSRNEPVRVASAPVAPAPMPVVDPNQATVVSIERVEAPVAEGSGVGAVGGGVVGGLLGNQVGGGNGRKAMTVIGAIGGAVAGNAIEKRVRTTEHFDVRVRLGDGSTRVLRYDEQPQFQPGDRIRLDERRAS